MYDSLYMKEIKQTMKCAMQTLVFSTCQLEIRVNCWCFCVMLEWLPMHCVYLNTHTHTLVCSVEIRVTSATNVIVLVTWRETALVTAATLEHHLHVAGSTFTWLHVVLALSIVISLPARRYASAGNRHSNVSVCLSVTHRYCVKTKKASGMISSPSARWWRYHAASFLHTLL